ncbi:nucleoside monophosphate kinase, partial [Limosilactobacillus fermentum]|uniref:nucleoside monophosphate kinase n=1 Tax=Limosilactobacillus fermentum TaxID=1613 RepID=UPI0030EA2C50
VQERLAQEDTKDVVMLDGFPRNHAQADALNSMLVDSDRQLDSVINIHVRPEVLVERLNGRFICRNCGPTYHRLYNPTNLEVT